MSQQLRIVIIEDEAATARDLEFILKEINSDFEITAILQTVRESVQWLSSNADHYDLIFSDIHLSDGLSFEIFRQILILKPVIFVTAYDGYALEAFRNNGIGYILKPFDKEEINRSLLKYITLTTADNGLEQSKLLALLQQLQSPVNHYKKTFLIHYCGRLIPVEASKIYWFQTSNEMVYAQLENGQKYIVEYTLELLEQQLNPELFFFVPTASSLSIGRRLILSNIISTEGYLLLYILPRRNKYSSVKQKHQLSENGWLSNFTAGFSRLTLFFLYKNDLYHYICFIKN